MSKIDINAIASVDSTEMTDNYHRLCTSSFDDRIDPNSADRQVSCLQISSLAAIVSNTCNTRYKIASDYCLTKNTLRLCLIPNDND